MELLRKHEIPYHQQPFIETDSPWSCGREDEIKNEVKKKKKNEVEIENEVEDEVKMVISREVRGWGEEVETEVEVKE